MKWRVVVPSLKVSGGVREALKLTAKLGKYSDTSLLCMWDSPRSMSTDLRVERLTRLEPNSSLAAFHLLAILAAFHRWMRNTGDEASVFVFTHYSTLPLALLVPRERRYYFVQDLEWKFVASPVLSSVLRRVILYFYRRGNIISANRYLSELVSGFGLRVLQEAPVWADAAFMSTADIERDIDFAMVLRKGAHKRLDLYLAYIDEVRSRGDVRIAVISTEDEIVAAVRDRVATVLCRPSIAEMREVYERSKCFVHLSEHEGFGLPPLEAMGAGCVPLCRDSGGVRAFMLPDLVPLLIPLDVGVDEIVDVALQLIADADRLRRLGGLARTAFQRGLEASERARLDLGRLAH